MVRSGTESYLIPLNLKYKWITVKSHTWTGAQQDSYLYGSHTRPSFGKGAGRIDPVVNDATDGWHIMPNKMAESTYHIIRNVNEAMWLLPAYRMSGNSLISEC